MPDTSTVAGLADAGALPPRDFSSVPHRVREVAGIPLNLPSSVSAAISEIARTGYFEREALEEAVASLALGNLILAGPPGTGKTSLARALAQAFNARLLSETANPEWSVYDLVGTQTLGKGGDVVPKHGLVTSAVLACATTIVDNVDSGTGEQAVWLLIDEMNRADIDRAFGPLFTALAGGDDPAMVLDYIDTRPTLTLPRRFRLIGTVNEYDTRFVNSMSAALRRRFAKVTILPPTSDADGLSPNGEFEVAFNNALQRAEEAMGRKTEPQLASALRDRSHRIRQFLGFLRGRDNRGIPVGTAQLIDVLSYFLVFAAQRDAVASDYLSGPGDLLFWTTIDRSLVARLVPSLETDSTRSRIDNEFSNELSKMFPELPRLTRRLEAFLHGRD